MKRPTFHPFAQAALGLILTCSASAEFRNWTNSENRQVEAELASVEGNQVKLRLRNGTVATVMLVISFVLLLLINALQAWQRRRSGAQS
jgi:hypothetical protein